MISHFQINVQDVNDFTPVFEQSSYSISIREGLSVGSTVISVRATDQDTGKNGEVFYSILNSHDIDDAFRIDPSTGVLTTKVSLDREKRDEYTVLVQANDLSQSQIDRRSATTTVRVEVLDENDSYPQFSQKSYSVTVAENFDVSNYPVISRVRYEILVSSNFLLISRFPDWEALGIKAVFPPAHNNNNLTRIKFLNQFEFGHKKVKQGLCLILLDEKL
jgi:hypothetical protein